MNWFEPSIDAQIVDFKAAGADVLVQSTQAKYTAQGIPKWQPA